mmetsp:Transcript_69286/g.218933  ORF Transcript_69286/g.218933 Transcript_69286/m.218933 type:complete len:274 (-) Transcript_69286:561-1382(-)
MTARPWSARVGSGITSRASLAAGQTVVSMAAPSLTPSVMASEVAKPDPRLSSPPRLPACLHRKGRDLPLPPVSLPSPADPPLHQLAAATGWEPLQSAFSGPEGFHVRFWKPYGPRTTGAAGREGGPPRAPPDGPGGPRGRQGLGEVYAGERQPCVIGSGPGSRNLGPPAAVASCVTQPMGLGNCGDEGCRIWIRTMPFFSLKCGAVCSTISPSCSVCTSWLSKRSVARTTVFARATRHFFGGKCRGRGEGGGICAGSAGGIAPCGAMAMAGGP